MNTAGIQVLQISGWPAPFGITLVADLLAAMLVVAVGVVGVAVSARHFAGVDPRREAFGYHPLIQILLMGVSGAFLTGDLFNLYVWFEVMLVASFVLMALHPHQRAGGGGVQVRHDQPDRIVDLPHRARAALRRGRNAQHGRSRAGLADRSARPASTPCWRCCS